MSITNIWFCLKCGTCGISRHAETDSAFDITESIRRVHGFESKYRGKNAGLKMDCPYDPRVLNPAMCYVQELDEL